MSAISYMCCFAVLSCLKISTIDGQYAPQQYQPAYYNQLGYPQTVASNTYPQTQPPYNPVYAHQHPPSLTVTTPAESVLVNPHLTDHTLHPHQETEILEIHEHIFDPAVEIEVGGHVIAIDSEPENTVTPLCLSNSDNINARSVFCTNDARLIANLANDENGVNNAMVYRNENSDKNRESDSNKERDESTKTIKNSKTNSLTKELTKNNTLAIQNDQENITGSGVILEEHEYKSNSYNGLVQEKEINNENSFDKLNYTAKSDNKLIGTLAQWNKPNITEEIIKQSYRMDDPENSKIHLEKQMEIMDQNSHKRSETDIIQKNLTDSKILKSHSSDDTILEPKNKNLEDITEGRLQKYNKGQTDTEVDIENLSTSARQKAENVSEKSNNSSTNLLMQKQYRNITILNNENAKTNLDNLRSAELSEGIKNENRNSSLERTNITSYNKDLNKNTDSTDKAIESESYETTIETGSKILNTTNVQNVDANNTKQRSAENTSKVNKDNSKSDEIVAETEDKQAEISNIENSNNNKEKSTVDRSEKVESNSKSDKTSEETEDNETATANIENSNENNNKQNLAENESENKDNVSETDQTSTDTKGNNPETN